MTKSIGPGLMAHMSGAIVLPLILYMVENILLWLQV